MQNEPFQLGICMAGAVSAGAYTAGVLDCLLEALEGWEQKRGQDGVPTHRVTLSVIGGASAGGMTGLLTAAAVQQPGAKIFYKSWVEMEADSMANAMLDPTDISESGLLSSLLNGSFVERLSQQAIAAAKYPTRTLPAYIHSSLKLFTTLTNLKGYPYNISFTSERQKTVHSMSVHSDFACFQLADSPLTDAEQLTEYRGHAEPGWIPLNVAKGVNTKLLQKAIMATAAFPLVLKPVRLKRAKKMIQHNPWLNQQGLLLDMLSEEHISLQVDGGLMNNEPFEKVRELLQGAMADKRNPESERDSFSSFTNTILMIDPFPNTPDFQENDSLQLTNIARQILNAMLHQMKAKPLPIADMMNKEKAGQFLIAPVRYKGNPEEKIEGAKAIASGVVGGFGGFLSKRFRLHDYALGQYNCARFLQNHFTIPLKQFHLHPLFSKGYEDIDLRPFLSDNKDSVQIIPVFNLQKQAPDWPVSDIDFIKELKPAIQKRSAAILSNISRHWFKKRVLQLGGFLFINRYVANAVVRHIQSALQLHQLVQ